MILVFFYTQLTLTDWREFVSIAVFRFEIRFVVVPDPLHQTAELNKIFIISGPKVQAPSRAVD